MEAGVGRQKLKIKITILLLVHMKLFDLILVYLVFVTVDSVCEATDIKVPPSSVQGPDQLPTSAS